MLPADTYDHSGRAGSFQDGQWINQTASPSGGPLVYGNPGAADDAYFYGTSLTASGGSVRLLSGGNFSLSGSFNATNVANLTLSGAGTLNVQSLVTDVNGYGPLLYVAGGHVIAQNGDGVADVTAGGTVVDATCAGTNGCGFFDGGSSLTITGLGGPGRAILSHASTLTANGGLTNFTVQVQSGSSAQASTISDGLIRIDGAGSILNVSGDCSLNGQSMNISNGGAATVNGNLTQVQGAPLDVTDQGSTLTVGGDLMHNTASITDIHITNGATARVMSNLREVRGQVQLDGMGTGLTVDQTLSDRAGSLNLSNGSTLAVNAQFILDGGTTVDGFSITGSGTWKDAGTTVTSSGQMFIGNGGGSGFYLYVSAGAIVRSGELEIASNTGSVGTANVSGSGTTWEVQSGGLGVGEDGRGTFNVSSGGHLTLDGGTLFGVGLNSGANGTMTIDGANSSVDASQALLSVGVFPGSRGSFSLTNQASLNLGQDTFIGDAGSGSLNIGSGCHVTLTGSSNTKFGVANQEGSSGSISVQDGGNLNVDALFLVGVHGNGFAGVGGGGMVQSIAVALGGSANAVGTVVVDGAGSIWNSSGNVFIGYANEGAGKWTVSNGGALNVIGSRPKFGIGNLVGTTGELDIDGSGSQVTSGNFITGVLGTGTTNVTNGATLQTGSAAIGISRSSIGHVLVTDAGSQWTVTDNGIFIAGSGGLGGFSQGGPATLTIGSGGLVLVPRVIAIGRLGNIILTGGAVGIGTGANPAPNTLRVAADGILTGSGRVQGQVIVAQGGRVLPGNSPGVLTIDGNYEQDAGATYSAEIGGTDPGSGYDQISVTGSATLGGTLQVRLTNGFTPTVGQTFRLLNASSVSGAFASISEPSQAGLNLTSDANGITATVTSVVAGAPVISSASTANGTPGTPFSYQIAATNTPTSFGAMNLPTGLTVDNNTGLISGTPTTAGTFIVPINANNADGSAQADLTILIDSVGDLFGGKLLNISTRLPVQSGDNALIGGFIVTGTDAKRVIIRGIGPSLGTSGVGGTLADPVLELHASDGSLLASNDNWRDSQEAEIQATTIAPSNNLESAIVRNLAPGNYTAILRGNNGGTGTGLIEAYDLDQTANSTLANISTRGFVDTNDNVLIGGFIIGGGSGGFAQVVVRAIGPSLVNSGVANPLQDPTLELHDGNGALITSNDNWRETQQLELTALGLAPTNDAESAVLAALPPGNATAIVRGKNNSTGIGLVEVYNIP